MVLHAFTRARDVVCVLGIREEDCREAGTKMNRQQETARFLHYSGKCVFRRGKFVGCLKRCSWQIYLLTPALMGSDWAADATCFRSGMTTQISMV